MRKLIISLATLTLAAALALSGPASAQCPNGQCGVPAPAYRTTVAVTYQQFTGYAGYYFEYAGQWYVTPSTHLGATFTYQGRPMLAAPGRIP